MAADNIKNWEVDLVDCPSTTVPQKVADVLGGESITLKSESATDSYHLIGKRSDVLAGKAYKLWGGETMTITLGPGFGMNNKIEVWALPAVAGADITWFKVKTSNVEGLAELERMKKDLSQMECRMATDEEMKKEKKRKLDEGIVE